MTRNFNFVETFAFMHFMKSLSLKISISILTAVLLIFAAIIVYNYMISRDLLMQNVKERMMNLGDSKALQIDKMLESSQTIPQDFSFSLESAGYTLDEMKENQLHILENNPEIFGCCIAFEAYAFDPDSFYYAPFTYRDGSDIAFKYLNSDEMNYFEQAWYKVPSQSKEASWSQPYFDEGGADVMMCTYSVPFYAENDQQDFQGIVTIDISLAYLLNFVDSIKPYEAGYAFLISNEGTIITNPVSDRVNGENLFQLAEERNYNTLREIAIDIVNGGSDFIPYDSPLLEEETWINYTPIQSSGWSLAIIIPEGEFMGDLYELNRDLLLIAVLGFIILLIIVVFISKRITKPLRTLSQAADDIGHGNFDVKLPATQSKDEIAHLNASIRSMQKELKHYIRDLKETTAAKEKIESELQIARDIQQGIIPKIFPPFPDRESVDLYAVLDPARDVGGDLYDFFFVDDDHLCFTVGDVSGKGVPASLFMAITRTLLRARMDAKTSINEVMDAMNNELCLENDNAMFVTMFIGMLNVETGELEYCNAGHNYPFILISNSKAKELKMTHGTPLGAMPDISYGITRMNLSDRDTLVLYTDGISEAIDLEENQYTELRLSNVIEKNAGSRPEIMTREILKDLHNFVGEADQFDDITMLVLKWFNTAGGKNE